MKLVLIQGDCMANYIGAKRGVTVKVDNWDFDVMSFVEDFRVNGELAVA